jgi:putative transposase
VRGHRGARRGGGRGAVSHDQGSEYTGNLFVEACRSAGVTQSMGRTGSALDNVVSEAFNSTLEWELLRRNHFDTREQARCAVAAWIDEYDTDRRHSTNGMLSPVDYELGCATRRASEHDEPPSDGRAA